MYIKIIAGFQHVKRNLLSCNQDLNIYYPFHDNENQAFTEFTSIKTGLCPVSTCLFYFRLSSPG
jgi:hypothetical protein